MSTLHLEGVRDGIEDLELYTLLNHTVSRAIAAGIDATPEANALEVPDALLSGVSQSWVPPVRTFSEDPYALRMQRLSVMRAVESLQRKLREVSRHSSVE